ncbi:LuxR C-terminal-related transcriptional regulator [Streptomyces sp. NPDC000151]|uniref:LuxR C-terminal-related transcriptional regulator n=1 Tax=Streptomyces sp. NPDC000151 TaxID=3154244 RepID=UPI00331B6675
MSLGVLHRRPGTLPAEVTSFVGRRAELARLATLLAESRLVTVVGPGGVGKTRVALRAAAGAVSRFADGVCLTELSGLRGPELLPHTVAACLGLPEQDTRPQLDVVLDHLRERELLLVLDTCEHVLDGCALLADLLLCEAPGVRVLATSRQPLDVPGEHVLPVPPLPVPEPDPGPPKARGSDDAVALFAQRAASVVPGFAVTDANRSDVIKLCRRLDGIPLAIELATVRLRAVPLQQLIDRLEDRFRLLTGGRRTALPRHQTLRTAIGWSHDLCTAQERLLWSRLSVFAGTFDVAAAEEVCAGGRLPREDVLETQIGLIDKSVVLRSEDASGRTRYRLLDTLREFGGERLAGSGEEAAVRERHIARYLRLAASFDDHWFDDDQIARFHALRGEHADIRAALDYALNLPDGHVRAARLAGDLWGYWQIAGLLAEGRYWQTRVLDRFADPVPERAWALMVRGYLATFQGDPGDAVSDLDEGIALAERCGEPLMAGRGHVYRNLAMTFLGRYEEAAESARAAESLLSALDDRIGLCLLDAQQGYLLTLAGEFDAALARCAQGLRRVGEGSGERWQQSYMHLISGIALFFQGRHQEGGAAARTALAMKCELGDAVGTAYTLELLGWLAAATARFERSAWLLGAADTLWRRVGQRVSGTAALEEKHQHAEEAARQVLGEARFGSLHQAGAAQPLEEIAPFAIGDADRLTRVPAHAAEPDFECRSADGLTRREREVARLLGEGLCNREIAERLVISKRTVDSHVEHILAKLGAASRNEIATILRADGPDRSG